MSKKYTLFTFKGICMNFLLELRFFILSHPLTEKQPPKVVQIHMTHPVFPHTVSGETTFFFAFGNPEVTVHKPKGHST